MWPYTLTITGAHLKNIQEYTERLLEYTRLYILRHKNIVRYIGVCMDILTLRGRGVGYDMSQSGNVE